MQRRRGRPEFPQIHYRVDFTTHQNFGLWTFRTLFTFTIAKLSTTPTFSNKPCMGLTRFQWLCFRAMLLRILQLVLRMLQEAHLPSKRETEALGRQSHPASHRDSRVCYKLAPPSEREGGGEALCWRLRKGKPSLQ